MLSDNYLSRTDTPPPRIEGKNRALLIEMLGANLSQSKLSYVIKILRKDPSLCQESVVLSDTTTPCGLVQAAIDTGLESLIPFVLSYGVDVNTCIEGRNLLDYAVSHNSPSLVSTALAFGAVEALMLEKESDTEELSLISQSIHMLVSTASSISTTQKIGINLGRMLEVKHGLDALKISRMLLDANLPSLGNAIHSGLARLCNQDWSKLAVPEAQLSSLFQELLRQGGDVDVKIGGKPLLVLAIGAKNIPAVLNLLKVGVKTSESFLGIDLVSCLSKNGLSEHIPAITEFLMRNEIERANREASLESSQPTVEIIGKRSVPSAQPLQSFDVL